MTVEVIQDQFPIRKDSIEELAAHRNRCLEMARQAYVTLMESESCSKRAAPFQQYAGFLGRIEIDGHNAHDLDDFEKRVRVRVDRDCWISLLNHSGLRNLMDAKAHEEFKGQLQKDPPAFTAANIQATFMTLAADAPNILERSIVNTFESLTRRRTHVTNSAFGIGKKIIMTNAIGAYGWNTYGRYGREQLTDMERLFHVLDGKKPPEAQNFADEVGNNRRFKKFETESEYFHAKVFRVNGNLHLTFKRMDLVQKVNRLLAKHKGVTLPDDRRPT